MKAYLNAEDASKLDLSFHTYPPFVFIVFLSKESLPNAKRSVRPLNRGPGIALSN
jgi:hypothetical protein